MNPPLIYLDNHSTTKLDPEVFEAMKPWLLEDYGNASSLHTYGEKVAEAVESARKKIAELLGCRPAEIIFTSGATESNNMAIKGIVEAASKEDFHVITSSIEHSAVYWPVKSLILDCKGKFPERISIVEAKSNGLVKLPDFQSLIQEKTILASIIHVNNETGIIQDIESIGNICQENNIIFHTDATQSVGKLPINFSELPVDALSFSAHKFHGPKGVGALVLRRKGKRVKIKSLLTGGGQERNRRGGTLNVPGIIGMAKALEIAIQNMNEVSEQVGKMRDLFFNIMREKVPDIEENGDTAHRLYNSLSLYIPNIESVSLLNQIPNIALSTGAACSSTESSPSRVITSMYSDFSGRDIKSLPSSEIGKERARSTVRIGLSKFTTEEELRIAASQIADAVIELRNIASI